MANRHHAVHPPSSVSPNLAVNKKPNVAATPQPQPNPNPSRGPVGLDAINSRAPEVSSVPPAVKAVTRDDDDTDDDDLTDLDLSTNLS